MGGGGAVLYETASPRCGPPSDGFGGARARGPPLDQLATHMVCCARRGCGLACCALSRNLRSDPGLLSLIDPQSLRPETSIAAMLTLTAALALACAGPVRWGRNTRAADRLASRGFERASPTQSEPFASGPRDLIVVCHRTPEKVAKGRFRLENLPDGRVDLLARCASAAIFTSHGVRPETRLWLALQDQAVSLCFDGATARGMHPDERTLAAAMKRTLAVEHGATRRADTNNGWSYHPGGLEARLRELLQARAPEGRLPRPLVQLHEEGEATLESLMRAACEGALPETLPGAVLVFGDQLGYTADEEALLASLGGRRASCSSRGLLTSHCIVLAHHALDEAEAPAKSLAVQSSRDVEACSFERKGS